VTTLRVLNDIHVGVSRKSGTTPASASALSEFIITRFDELVAETDSDLLILGDLFDTFTVPTSDIWRVFGILMMWLKATGKRLILVAGNHDYQPRGMQMSSFQLLASLLAAMSDKVQVVNVGEGLTCVAENVYAIPHMPNQDLFDMELVKAAELTNVTILLHANFDNKFAERSDHSLNVTREQAKGFVDHGCLVMFAHEHQHRSYFNDKVVCLGNQIPSSVADCLGGHSAGQQDGVKYLHDLHGLFDFDGIQITRLATWGNAGDFKQVDWRELNGADAKFVRVTGTATSAEAAELVNAIAKFRQKSDAFVVTNAVLVDGIAEMNELPQSFENATKFDVIGFLLEQLEPKEQEVIKEQMSYVTQN